MRGLKIKGSFTYLTYGGGAGGRNTKIITPAKIASKIKMMIIIIGGGLTLPGAALMLTAFPMEFTPREVVPSPRLIYKFSGALTWMHLS
jgi:hypothetical protein